MRAVVAYTRNDAGASPYLDSVLGKLDDGGNLGLTKLTFPRDNPTITAVIADAGGPPIQWAQRPDGSFAMLDGEIFNKANLFHSNSSEGPNDADSVLELYLSSGEAGIARLDAAASVVIWDARKRRLLAFRDCRGIVPSYWWEQDDTVVWATDIGTLLNAGAPTDINLAALDFFLGNGFVPAPWTFADKISKIPPAHVLSCSEQGSIGLRRYYWPRGGPKLHLPEAEKTDILGRLLKQSLARRCASNGRTGVLLSGGVDSKLIVAGLAKWFRTSVDTFTFRYGNYKGEFNEVNEAHRTAKHFGARHHELLFQPCDIADNLDAMVRSYGEPFTYGLHTYMLRDVHKTGISELLNGAGPDGWYLNQKNVQGLRYAWLPPVLQKIAVGGLSIARWLNARTKPLWLWRLYSAAGQFADEAEVVLWCARHGLPVTFSGTIIPERFRDPLYCDSRWVLESRLRQKELFDTAARDFDVESARDRITFVHRHFKNAEGTLHWNYWWGRAHNLSIRFPYFDDDLLGFAMRLPRKSFYKEEVRQLAATLMPKELAYTPKLPQTVPIRHWFRGPLRDFLCDQLSPARLQNSGLFNSRTVENHIREHLRGGNDHGWKLWAILTVLVWQELAAKKDLQIPATNCSV